MRVIQLHAMLSEVAHVSVWSEWTPEPSLARRIPIRLIQPRRGELPMRGTLIFVGFYFPVGRWAWLSLARRRIIICNTLPQALGNFMAMRRRVSCCGLRSVEVAYAGFEVAERIGEPGPIHPSPIDLVRFTPRTARRAGGDFRVGRLSRDVIDKHHEGAPELYRRLVSAGCTVRILGGSTLREWIPGPPAGLELLSMEAEDPAEFLRDLDCFLYRTNDNFFEPFGRVVFEAMATGLPVVAHQCGGYARFLRNGEEALLFDTDEEAFALVMRLKADPVLRERIGRNGRRRVEQMYAGDGVSDMVRYFLK